MFQHLQSPSFTAADHIIKHAFRTWGQRVHTERWQGKDISKKPDMVTYELLNVTLRVPLLGEENIAYWANDTRCNLPWADDHFLERVGGEPLNPGKTWEYWPWATSANGHRNGSKQFNHTYMERFWPLYARKGPYQHPTTTPTGRHASNPLGGIGEEGHKGVTTFYGDLEDLAQLLAREPLTRQAYIPLFFPEDTGFGDGGRKPCTLGYQFIMRDGGLHCYYPMRSCDFVRHWPDDCYLAVRLLLWVLDRCRQINPEVWNIVAPASLTMHMTSLHIFENDKRSLGV